MLPDVRMDGASEEGDKRPLCSVVVHGVSPAPETPLLWLMENCSHPDGFLHIIVKDLSNESAV